MNELDHFPDDFWRKAFDGADEQPPQRVWDAVERQLDEDSKARVLPLWGAALLPGLRTLTWGAGAAASVALLLAGWWYTQSTNQFSTTSSVAARTGQHAAGPANAPIVKSIIQPDHKTAPLIASAAKVAPGLPARHIRSSVEHREQPVFTLTDNNNLIADISRQYGNAQSERTAQFVQTSGFAQPTLQSVSAPDLSPGAAMPPMATAPMAAEVAPATGQPGTPLATKLAVANTSASQSAQAKAAAAWAGVEASSDMSGTDGLAKAKKREKWASISIMPGAYNPAVALASAATPMAVASYASNVNRATVATTPVVDSRSSRSMAYQVSAGIQLTERWSVESGVGYLSAQSTVESPTQISLASAAMLTAKDAQVANNLFVDALRNRVISQTNAYAAAATDINGSPQSYVANRYSTSEQQAVSNDYQFVQVPVQVGYQLRPRKLLGLALIGGFLTNIFVRNTVANQVVITPADDIYRSLSLSASVGARFRYRPSQHWSASLAGLYQPTIGGTTSSDSPIRSQPTTTGMSFGVDYHF